jgi:hypothetical protein
LTRVAVILHERLGSWNRQLRPRLSKELVRWFESRSAEDLEGFLSGLAFPVVLIDLGRQSADGLAALSLVPSRAPDARTLVLDPEAQLDSPALANELGATCVFTGFAPPPAVTRLLSRWIAMAQRGIESAGWSRATFPDTATEPWSWLSDYLGEPHANPADRPGTPRCKSHPSLDRPHPADGANHREDKDKD